MTEPVLHRVGSTPQERGSQQGMNCPDIFVYTDERGDRYVAVIGKDISERALPEGSWLAPDDCLVALPTRAVHDALPELREL
jgi:hypothetical protein